MNHPLFFLPPPALQQPPQLPHRASVALRLFTHLSEVLCEQAVPHGLGVETIAARKLDTEEQEVFGACSKFLADYLLGKVELKSEHSKQLRSLIRCVQCGGTRSVAGVACELCRGTGALSCEPANPDGSEA